MNNLSALPHSASDSRLSSPEAAAPNAVSPALLARRQKLRRLVAWVVGGAALLTCAGLVLAAVRSHEERVAEAAATAAPTPVQFVAAAPTQAALEPAPSAAQASDSKSPEPVAAAASSASAKPAKKRTVVTHVNKLKRPSAKTVVTRH
jgi:hypothetical protein